MRSPSSAKSTTWRSAVSVPLDVAPPELAAALAALLASGQGHLATLNGGPPCDADLWGWTAVWPAPQARFWRAIEAASPGAGRLYAGMVPNGPRVGHLDPRAAYLDGQAYDRELLARSLVRPEPRDGWTPPSLPSLHVHFTSPEAARAIVAERLVRPSGVEGASAVPVGGRWMPIVQMYARRRGGLLGDEESGGPDYWLTDPSKTAALLVWPSRAPDVAYMEEAFWLDGISLWQAAPVSLHEARALLDQTAGLPWRHCQRSSSMPTPEVLALQRSLGLDGVVMWRRA